MDELTPNWPSTKRVAIVVDTVGWFDRYAKMIVASLNESGVKASFIRKYQDVPEGEIAFFLSCMRITPPEILERNQWNLVVHASALPKGRGFSPIVWQVLEGASVIPVTMITMSAEVDAGNIVMQEEIQLEGHELNDEMRDMLGRCILAMCLEFVQQSSAPQTLAQQGESSWYDRRYPEDSRLDPKQSILSQFNLLRVVDNENYPAFFDHLGQRYVLRIEKSQPTDEPA